MTISPSSYYYPWCKRSSRFILVEERTVVSSRMYPDRDINTNMKRGMKKELYGRINEHRQMINLDFLMRH